MQKDISKKTIIALKWTLPIANKLATMTAANFKNGITPQTIPSRNSIPTLF